MAATARRLAFDALTEVRRRQAYLGLYLDAAFRRGEISPADRRLATAIASGVLRMRRRLDWHIARLSKIPTHKMEPAVLDALRMGVYQLVHMPGMPPSAAVNETVGLVPVRARGFVNGLLRELSRNADRLLEPQGADDVETLGICFSLPDWIVRMWADHFGLDRAREMAEALASEPAAVLRAEKDRDELMARLREEGVEAHPTRWSPRGIRVANMGQALSSPAFAEGLCAVQGEASQIVGELVGAVAGESVLDLCAAPGGKATYLSRAVGPNGRVVAADHHQGRLRLVTENAKRLRLENIVTVRLDASEPFKLDGSPFDRVLVDSPCTGLGQLARHPEARWRIDSADPRRMAETQFRILQNAAGHVRPGGLLVFAVCTISPPENRLVTDRFLEWHPEFAAVDANRLLPERMNPLVENGDFLFIPTRDEPEGFYARAMRRSGGL